MSVERIVMAADKATMAAWQEQVDKKPVNDPLAYTAAELAKNTGIPLRTMQTRLKQWLSEGTCVVSKGYRPDLFGRQQVTPVYKLVPDGKPNRKRAK